MATLIDTLTASGGTESAGFLNDIVEQLWPNICVAGAKIVKEAVEPILASTLPGPLSSLHFVKLDFGHVPLRFSHVDVHKTTTEGIKLDMNLDWEGVCDIELDGNHVPKIGIEKVQLRGRLSVLFCPLTNIIPLIGALQVSFINTPTLNLDFTDAANIADCSLIAKTVRNTILGIISSMFVLPNRFLVKLDANTDYFKTHHPDHGIIRLTIGKATGINPPKKSGASKFLAKIVKDIPDCYVKVDVGAEQWRTSVQKNKYDPEWNETHDFLVSDYEQTISVDVQDDDLVGDDDVGIGSTTIKEVLLNGGTHELNLTHKGEPTEVKLTVHADFYNFIPDASLLTAVNSGKDSVCGIVTILIAGALGLSGQRDELNPAVSVTWGDKKFLTAAKTYTPGVDIFNPSFDQAFKIPLTSDMLASPGNFRISLMNEKDETGSAEVSFQDVLGAPGMVKEGSFDVGSGASVRASISVHGIQLAK
ncbi:Nn.00g029890.m01.CDS01 [Neocucurbitaria sp. VM-36]